MIDIREVVRNLEEWALDFDTSKMEDPADAEIEALRVAKEEREDWLEGQIFTIDAQGNVRDCEHGFPMPVRQERKQEGEEKKWK